MYSSHIHTSKPELGLQPAVVVLVVVVVGGGGRACATTRPGLLMIQSKKKNNKNKCEIKKRKLKWRGDCARAICFKGRRLSEGGRREGEVSRRDGMRARPGFISSCGGKKKGQSAVISKETECQRSHITQNSLHPCFSY